MPLANVEPLTQALARRTLFGFILTFIASRTMVLLIMSRRVPNFYFFLRGTHVHHLNYGIFLLASVCAYALFWSPTGRGARIAALLYGAAMALTFDEFGMWLHLGGSYWQRSSIDAVVIVAALFGLGGWAFRDMYKFPFGPQFAVVPGPGGTVKLKPGPVAPAGLGQAVRIGSSGGPSARPAP